MNIIDEKLSFVNLNVQVIREQILNGLHSESISRLKVFITEDQIDLMCLHARELIKWNRKMNLTAIKDPVLIAEKHYLDSIAAASFLSGESFIADFGSGGGFPGIVIKILRPDTRVLLIDASRKKVNFLKHVIRTLDLKNTNALHTRIENLQKDSAHQIRFDAVVSRAFTQLSSFSDLARPFLNPDGAIYAMKGKNAEAEISPDLSKQFSIQTFNYQLPFEKSERYMIKLTS